MRTLYTGQVWSICDFATGLGITLGVRRGSPSADEYSSVATALRQDT